MGDGHHGWAAAEIVLFVLDCLICAQGNTLHFFPHAPEGLIKWGTNVSVKGVATALGKASCSLNYETEQRLICSLSLEPVSDKQPAAVEIHLPFFAQRVMAITQGLELNVKAEVGKTRIRCSSGNAMMLLEK